MYGQRDYNGLLHRVQQETDETVVLVTQNDLFIQYVTIIAPAHDYKMLPAVGGMRVMSRSTAGLALMSQMSDRQVEKLIRQIHYYELSNTETLDMKTLMREVAWVRQTGYCFMSDNPPGAASIAVPLGDERHGIQMAIGVGGLNDRISDNKAKIVEILRNAVADFRATCDEEDEARPE
jgi:DNA-binding IclR family transcriptional regulator